MSQAKTNVLLKLTDLLLEDTTSEVLSTVYNVLLKADGAASVDAIVCDASHAEAASRAHPIPPLILVNVTDEKSLAGKTALLEIAAFVPPPATARRVLAAVQQVAVARAA